jgi:1,4-alpha-glucan branching enzyme
MYRDLIRLRRNWFDDTRGLCGQSVNVYHVNNTDKVVAFHRWDQGGAGDDVVVVLNFANRQYAGYTLGFPRGGIWHVRLNSDWNGYSSDFSNAASDDVSANPASRDSMNFEGTIGLGPYTAIILSQ